MVTEVVLVDGHEVVVYGEVFEDCVRKKEWRL